MNIYFSFLKFYMNFEDFAKSISKLKIKILYYSNFQGAQERMQFFRVKNKKKKKIKRSPIFYHHMHVNFNEMTVQMKKTKLIYIYVLYFDEIR